MIGLHLYTLHTSPVPCDDTVGIYYRGENVGGGIFKNSECRFGAWGGWTLETNILTVDPIKAKAGAVVGLVAGYERRPIFPLLLPSIAISFDGKSWLRATYLPKFKTAASGVSFSVEFAF